MLPNSGNSIIIYSYPKKTEGIKLLENDSDFERKKECSKTELSLL